MPRFLSMPWWTKEGPSYHQTPAPSLEAGWVVKSIDRVKYELADKAVELSTLQSQFMKRRIPSRECLQTEVAACESACNTRVRPIHWRFTHENSFHL